MTLRRIPLCLAVLLSLVLAATPALAEDEVEPAAAPRVMVVGDSISSGPRYGPATTERSVKAWWAHLATTLGTGTPTISAQAGSGMLKKGNRTAPDITEVDQVYGRCTGKTFGERLDEITAAAPDVLIVEGGRNDFTVCRTDKAFHLATSDQTRTAIARYMSRLRSTVNALGMDPAKVFVLTPWGSDFDKYRDIVTYNVEKYATHYGFRYVPVPELSDTYTYDRTHPNAKGTRRIAATILGASDIARAVDPTAADTRVTPIRNSCVGTKACTAKYGRIAYASVRTTSFWGQSPTSGGTNFVAYRLKKRGIKKLAGRTANEWRVSARQSSKAFMSGRPTVGSVAWWPRNPVSRSTKGHVAYVTKVYDDSVLVQEELANHRYRVTRYYGSAYPRGFITFKK